MKLKSILILGAALAASVGFGQTPPSLDGLVGKPVPNFKMTDIKGKTWTNASLKGKVVLFDFWATWCGPCKKASPIMQQLYKKYGKSGLVVVGAETLENGQPAGAKAYASEHGYTYTFTTNNDSFTQALNIQAIPAFILVGKDGKVKRAEMGIPENIQDLYKSFEKSIKPLLK